MCYGFGVFQKQVHAVSVALTSMVKGSCLKQETLAVEHTGIVGCSKLRGGTQECHWGGQH